MRTKTKRSSAGRIVIGAIVMLVSAGVSIALHRANGLELELSPVGVSLAVEASQSSPLAWPSYGQAAIANSQYGVIETHGDTTPHPTASTAKVITMLAVLEKKPLEQGEQGPVLTMTQRDVDSHAWYVARNGSNTPVQVGLQLTQYQAIQSVLLASSNNMSDTLAIWAFGSIEAYHAYANAMVHGWGLEHTTIAGDASGLSPLTTSTAADLAQVALRALDHPVLAEIAAQSQANIPGAGVIRNTNSLLINDEIVGMKTGETVEAGGNFILAGVQKHDAESQKIVVVVMGATLSTVAQRDSYGLFQAAMDNFSYQDIVKEGQVVAKLSVPWLGDALDIAADQTISGWVWAGAPPTVDYSPMIRLVSAGNELGLDDSMGSVLVSLEGGATIGQADAQLSRTVPPPSLWWKLGYSIGL